MNLSDSDKPLVPDKSLILPAGMVTVKVPKPVAAIAHMTHEVNRAYCRALGDNSQPAWDDAPDWQKNSAINGVLNILENPAMTPEESHDAWSMQKISEGWVYGEVKDPEKKTHPCLVEYSELPEEQQKKDLLFGLVARLGIQLLIKHA